jgi:hypothetical protein
MTRTATAETAAAASSLAATAPTLEVGAPFFLDGRRCAVVGMTPTHTKFAGEGFSGSCATAEIVFDPDFAVFHLPGRLHRPVRTAGQGTLAPVEG